MTHGAERGKTANWIAPPKTVINIIFGKMGLTDAHLNGSRRIYLRRTAIGNFPTGWSAPSVSITDTFEGAHVYRSLADGQYYLIVEDLLDNRYYELWRSSAPGGHGRRSPKNGPGAAILFTMRGSGPPASPTGSSFALA